MEQKDNRDEPYFEKIQKYGRDVNPFFKLMGIDVTKVEEGKAYLSMKVRPDMLNGVGWLQGAIFTALADEAMALALYTRTDRHERIATVSESSSFLKGARTGTIVASGWVVKKARQVAFMEGEVRRGGEEGELLAQSNAVFVIMNE